ncbi:hypothetical protein O5D80_005140 [Batrachochytrium dendrobatidis]|nr:hypothetical protein O5D80_005140 [Batrachochytrium dendrobatidis]
MDFSQTKLLLQQYYNINSECIPQQREKSKWKPENNFGFLLGVIAFGMATHRTQLHSLLVSRQFKDQENAFIDSMFDYYIRPFHKNYITDSEICHTPFAVSSGTPSRTNSAEDLGGVPEEKELLHKDLKKAVVKRDGVCLFCWDTLECEGAHIIAQKNVPMAYDEDSLFIRAGITQKHQVQNGLLLCNKCHGQFDKLKRYVDVADDKLVVKVVNETNDTTSNKHKEWKDTVRVLKGNRMLWQENWTDIDNRQSMESNGEMALYFVQNNPTKLPNRNALEFHKTACMIWRMAGGAETDDEYCSDDDDLVPVDTAALKRRFKLQDSDETLNIVS